MEILFFITLFLYLFIIGSTVDYVDYDFFARLIVGKTYFQTGDILKYDFLSYSKTHPWYDHEWGASVIFYFIQDNFGDTGLYIFKTVCLFLTFFFFAKIIKLRRKMLHPDKEFPIFNFFFFFLMIQPVYNLIFSLRCHHFTFMFFAIWIYVLEKARLEKNYRILWCLPLLMMVWSNIHGGCFMALGVTGLYMAGEFIRKKPFLPYLYTFIASFLIMFINPYGFDYVKFLVEATTMNRPNIIEWRPPFCTYFFDKFMKFKIVLLGFMILSVYRFIKTYKNTLSDKFISKIKIIWENLDKTKFILLFVMFLLSMKSIRFISYFIFVLLPFCYDDFYAIFNKQLKPSLNKLKEQIIFAIVAIVFILNVGVRDIKYSDFHSIFPITEVEYLYENDIRGNVFTPFETGSYTAYKLFPNNFIYLDGRYEEVYDPELNDETVRRIVMGDVEWRELFDSTRHDAVITYKKYPLYENLKTRDDYYPILESKTFALFIRKDVWDNLKKAPTTPTSSSEYYRKILWNTQINWQKQ